MPCKDDPPAGTTKKTLQPPSAPMPAVSNPRSTVGRKEDAGTVKRKRRISDTRVAGPLATPEKRVASRASQATDVAAASETMEDRQIERDEETQEAEEGNESESGPPRKRVAVHLGSKGDEEDDDGGRGKFVKRARDVDEDADDGGYGKFVRKRKREKSVLAGVEGVEGDLVEVQGDVSVSFHVLALVVSITSMNTEVRRSHIPP
ncbi:uncharacterized protein EV422DRAFT_298776 [Fimicolochytrium jonesii]|uniref:uncharacterized protein n=1 Tax=Fimicolochytrium jonesii TaxID=1396493 RepID=UPI0022FEE0ED|nr:uncharacterized protein EV422DRAFT_298776 [Fimicolochytrium jonesii]KAI8816214.1 hypothetical protein EV422DRAFT_298776 [Fimicolochytrium jonesii]